MQLNQTIVINPSDVATQTVTESVQTSNLDSTGFDFIMLLRIIWYVFCFFKILSIAFFSRPKPTIRERVLRKFLVSHNELVKGFSEEDIKNMQVILENTTKNASTCHTSNGSRIRKKTKSVNFQIQKNDYYDPKQWKEEPVFFDIVNNQDHPLHLHQNTSFEQKKHEQEFIEREDLLGLDEKTAKLSKENEEEKGEEVPAAISDLEEKIQPPKPIIEPIVESQPIPEVEQEEDSPLL